MTDLQITTTDGVLTLRMNRPEQRNALTGDMATGIAHELEQAAADDAVRVVVISGAGQAFSSGADLTELVGDVDFEEVMVRASRMLRAIPTLAKPVLAAVHGPAAGVSAGMALACDLVVAAESASFLLPFTRIGLMPDGGTTTTVAASIGRARAMRMGLLAEPLTGREAYDAGLISHLVSDAELETTVAELATRLAAGPPLALAATKRAVNAATLTGFEDTLEREARGQVLLAGTRDLAEGLGAFLEKREPRFVGR